MVEVGTRGSCVFIRNHESTELSVPGLSNFSQVGAQEAQLLFLASWGSLSHLDPSVDMVYSLATI